MRCVGERQPLARARENLRRGPAATHPSAAELAQVDGEPARTVRGAGGRCRHALQQRVVFIDAGIAAHANPLGRPAASLP